MKRAKIYTIDDSNVAGQEWRWTFTLECQPDATFTLSAKQKLIKRGRGDEPFEIEPVSGLTDGEGIYHALCEMLSDDLVNNDPTAIDRELIAAEIAKAEKVAAERFLEAKGCELRG